MNPPLPDGAVPHGYFNRADLQRTRVAAVYVGTGAKEREHSLGEAFFEGVDGCQVQGVGEAHLPGLVVQLHPDSLKMAAQLQLRGRRRHGRVKAVRQRDGPETRLWTARDFPLPGYGLPHHADDPVVVVLHLHLPGVAPRVEALGPKHEDKVVEALGVVGKLLHHAAVADLGQVFAQLQAGVGRVGVQSHGS